MLVPQPKGNWALFLDLDGTLLDIAERPEKVVVPEDLSQSLLMASRYLGGALAIVSGRQLADIDSLLSPARLPTAAEHGAVLRFPDGSLLSGGAEFAVPEKLRARLRTASRCWPGARVEDKRFNIVVHYRQATNCEAAIRDFVESAVALEPSRFEVLPARMAFEIRHRDLHKGMAVRALMGRPPFAGRIPVFVGDDVTDDDGFAAARALNGLALDVRHAFGGSPERVRDWLRTFGANS